MIEASSKLDQILMDCIQAIEEKGWTIEECLRRYPHLRQDLGPMLEAAIRLKDVRSVEPSRRFKRETLGRMQLRLQASRRPPKTASFQRRMTSEGVAPRARIRPQKRSALQSALPVLVGAFVFISMVGGFTYAADAANPGDALYQVDKVIEQVQIRLTPSTEGRTKLFLDFASERIDEAFALLEKGRSDQVIVALQGYEESIHAAETILENVAGKEDYPHLVALLNETLEMQTGKLRNLMAVAPETVQSSILAVILKIDNLRIAMAIPSPTATATPRADGTFVSPEPTDTGLASATSPPSTTPVADGTPVPSSTPIVSSTPVTSSTPAASLTPISPTATNPTAVASPTVAASHTPTPTYPPVTGSPSPTPTHTRTPTPSPTPSNTPIPGPDLTVSTYQWSPTLPEGSLEFLDYIVRNIGTTTAQGGYLVQLYVDDVPLQNIEPEIGVREGRLLYAGEVDLNYFHWIATCGIHRLKIVVDEENIIQESNESNNFTEDYTITVNCGTPTPP
jgi:hypothetical protein